MTLPSASPSNKTLVLGTALWGWGVEYAGACQILERFLARGGQIVDTAANYPINRRSQDFGLAAKWIAEWIAANDADSLSVLVKIGATDNLGSAASDLSESNLLRSEEYFRNSFGSALSAIAIHWDNRGDNVDDEKQISKTLKLMSKFDAQGLSIGFSGLRRPDLYLAAAPGLAEKWWIQVKEHAQTSATRQHYAKYFPHARYLAYGINMGGLKNNAGGENSSMALRGLIPSNNLAERLSNFLNSDHGLTPAPTTFNELALLITYINSALSGIIIGPRNIEQLNATMDYWNRLATGAATISTSALSALDTFIKSIQNVK